MRRDALGVVAVVAQQAAVAAVEGQGDGAVDALDALAAGAAGDEARKAAPVQQQHGLLAALEARADGLQEPAREGGLLARFQELGPHVQDLDLGHGAPLDALGQLQQRVLAALGVVAALQAGRGRAQHHAGAGRLRAHDGHVAAVVARRFLLLVALVVLLVDDDQAQVPRPARTRPSACPPPRRPRPRGCAATARRARTSAKARVQDGHAVAEAVEELAGHGGGERDLGDQHQRAAPHPPASPRWRSGRFRSCPSR